MAEMTNLQKLKMILREEEMPFFTDAALEFYLAENSDSVGDTAYMCLTIKSEETSLQIGGMSMADTSKYFLRLSKMYRPNNSGTLMGG